MQKRFGLVSKPRGPVVPFASVLVKTDPGGVVATIYSDNDSTPLANPLTCDRYGQYSYYAADGLYSETISGPAIDTVTTYGILINAGGSGDIAVLQAEVDALDARVTVLEGAAATLEDDLGDTNATVSALAGDVSDLAATVTTLTPIEGSFTPALAGLTTPGSGTYNTQYGEYVRTGDLAFFTLEVDWSAHTGTGDLVLTGMPFSAGGGGIYIFPVAFFGFSVPAGDCVVAQYLNTSFYFTLVGASAGAPLSVPGSGGTIRITGTFKII